MAIDALARSAPFRRVLMGSSAALLAVGALTAVARGGGSGHPKVTVAMRPGETATSEVGTTSTTVEEVTTTAAPTTTPAPAAVPTTQAAAVARHGSTATT